MNPLVLFSGIFFAVSAIISGAYLAQTGGSDLHLPLSGFSWMLMALTMFPIAYRMRARAAEQSEFAFQTKAFALFFVLFGSFLFTMALPHISLLSAHENHEVFGKLMNRAYVLGHVFLYLSLAALVRVPLSLTAPKYANAGALFFLVLGAGTTLANLMLPNAAEFYHAAGLTLLNADPFVGKLVAANVALAWIPAALYFFWNGISSSNSFVRARGILLGAGFLVATVGGPLHDIGRSALLFLVADIVTLLGVLMIAAGVFLSPERKDSAPEV